MANAWVTHFRNPRSQNRPNVSEGPGCAVVVRKHTYGHVSGQWRQARRKITAPSHGRNHSSFGVAKTLNFIPIQTEGDKFVQLEAFSCSRMILHPIGMLATMQPVFLCVHLVPEKHFLENSFIIAVQRFRHFVRKNDGQRPQRLFFSLGVEQVNLDGFNLNIQGLVTPEYQCLQISFTIVRELPVRANSSHFVQNARRMQNSTASAG